MLMIGKVCGRSSSTTATGPMASAVAIALLLFLVIPIMFLDRAQNTEPAAGDRK